MEKPNLPGYVALSERMIENTYIGEIQHSFAMSHSVRDRVNRVRFWWSSPKATSNFGGSFVIDGYEDAIRSKQRMENIWPGIDFKVWDINDPNLPIEIDWDEWRKTGKPAKTLSGITDKFIHRNPSFTVKETAK